MENERVIDGLKGPNEEEWIDITELCKEAASQLTFAEPMVHTSDFSLFESMSAVELMDPKMDQCCELNCSLKLQDLIKFEIPYDLMVNHVVGFLKQLLVCETQYFDGASQLESIYQCLFSWPGAWSNLATNESKLVQIMLLCSKDCAFGCHYLMKGILNVDIYEEEEFVCNTRSMPAEPLPEGFDTIQEIQELIVQLESEDKQHNPNKFQTILIFLHLRLSIHQLFKTYEQFSSEGMRITFKSADATNYDDKFIVLILEHSKKCIEAIQQLQNLTLKESEDKPDISSDLYAFAFSPIVSQSITTTPIRQITSFTFPSCLSYLLQLFTELNQQSHFLLNGILLNESICYHDILYYITSINEQKKHIITRSLVWTALHYILYKFPVLITSSMIYYHVPHSILAFEMCQKWTLSIAKVLWDTLRTFLTHRYKLLARLDNTCQHWGNIMKEASIVDTRFLVQYQIENTKQQYMTAWGLILTTWIMDKQMGLVIESELLSTNELDSWYWYWDYVLSTRVLAMTTLRELSHELQVELIRERQFQAQEGLKLLRHRNLSQKEKNKQKLELQAIIDQPLPAADPLTVDETITRVRLSLCKGLFRIYIVLQKLGFISKTESLYTSAEWHFTQRFRAFQHIENPQPLNIDMFTLMTVSEPNASHEDILTSASQCFRAAKIFLDDLKKIEKPTVCSEMLAHEQLMPLMKVNVASSVANLKTTQAVRTLSSEKTGDATSHPRLHLVLESSHHSFFLVPELRQI